jgi:diguanylate cyclase (GGDEF)-like protein
MGSASAPVSPAAAKGLASTRPVEFAVLIVAPLLLVGAAIAAWPALTANLGLQTPPESAAGSVHGNTAIAMLIALAAFMASASVIQREKLFLLAAAWLVSAAASIGLVAGWRVPWFGLDPATLLLQDLRGAGIALHGVTTLVLAQALQPRAAHHPPLGAALTALTLGWLALGGGSFVAPPWLVDSLFGAMALATIGACLALAAGARVHHSPGPSTWFAIGLVAFAAGVCAVLLVRFGVIAPATGSALLLTGLGGSAVLCSIAVLDHDRLERARTWREPSVDTTMGAAHAYLGVPVGLCTIDGDGRVIELNPELARMVGVAHSDLLEQRRQWDSMFGASAFEYLQETLASSDTAEIELATGTASLRRWFHVRARRNGDLIEAAVEEITQRKDSDIQLRQLAHRDALTGLLNRRGFGMRYQQAIAAVAQGHDASIAYLDLDRFKVINEVFGHSAGDHLLRDVGERLKASIRPPHACARIGGDEYLILYAGIAVQEAKASCEALLAEIAGNPCLFEDKAFGISASIGLARLEPDTPEQEAILAADRACVEAKRHGGARVFALDDTDENVRTHLEEVRLVGRIREALPDNRLSTALQPIVSLRAPEQSLNYEVLLRMRDADGNPISAQRVISAAERNGLMGRIDRWVVRDTLWWLDSNPRHRDRLTFASINVSGATLNDERSLEDILAMLRAHPACAPKLCFEITESVALYDLARTRRFIDTVKSFGATVALDDFGAGYTSFNYLKELGGDLLKVDGNFMRDVNRNAANLAIARAITDVGHELGMACVAEWAETPEILRALVTLGVDYAQGHALSAPLSHDDVLDAPHGAALLADSTLSDLLRGAHARRFEAALPALSAAAG